MGKRYFTLLFSVVLLALLPVHLRAQVTTEEDVIKNAAAAFDQENYGKAMPLYSQLLANHPNDPNYNYRFGVCMLFASSDKGKALPFLEEASKNPKCEVDVWFYLGRAYHLNYRFDEAIVAFNKYKTLAGEKKSEKLQVDNQIAMCKTGKKLLKAVTDITVLDKKELPRADFFRSYNLDGYSGQLLVKPDEFKTSLDRKKNETSIIYLSSEKNTLYYSSYGEDESNGKDIYRIVRLPTGGWSKPYNVGYPINTEYDEDYPFLHPNGKVLYFSSKGHNSMGGYDIFRSELNEETGSWLKPTNLDFAINSPDDDIMFVPDMDEKTAWFASSRNSPQGQMMVYHVVIERRPVNSCIISGTFKPTGADPTANAKITVRNEENNQPIGVYNSNATTGKYLINVPNTGGKYTFTVEKSGNHTQTKTVLIPPQYELKPIRQEIFYSESDGEQNLNIVTFFDDDTASFAPDFLRDKANLDVNPNAGADPNSYEVVDLGNPNGNGNPTVAGNPVDGNDSSDIPGGGTDPSDSVPSSSQGKVTTAELISTAFENAEIERREAIGIQQQSDRAFLYAADMNRQAIEAQKVADNAKSNADALPEGPEKQNAIAEWQTLQGKANTLKSQTVAALNVANGLKDDAKHQSDVADVADKYAKALDKGSKQTGPRAMDEANSLEQQLNDINNTRQQGQETANNAQEAADTKRENLQLVNNQLNDAKEEKQANLELLNKLRADSAKEKDPDLREGYAAQIEGVLESISDNEIEIKKKQGQVNRMTNELNALDAEAAGARDALAASKDPAVAPTALSPEDRKALEDNVVAYQNRVEDSNNPTVYAPVTQNPNTQNPVVTNPNTQNPETQNPVVTNPNTQNPETQNPVVTNPNTQNPETQNPVVTNPNTQNPETQNPVVTNPNTQNPNTQEPIADAGDVISDVNGSVSEAIQIAENETDSVKREQMIGDAHRDAEQQLGDKIKNTEQQLLTEKDPNRQLELKRNIEEYSTEKQRHHDEAIASDNRQKEMQSGVATVSNPEDPFTEYINGVADADTISDPVVRQSTKAGVYAEWGTQLETKIAGDKELMSRTKDKTAKDSLKQLIAAEEVQLKEIRQDEKDAKAAEQAAIAQVNSPGAKSDAVYSNQIAATNENQNAEEREAVKETIYNNWADSLDTEAEKLEGMAVKERNGKKRQELETQAQTLRTAANEKRDSAAAAHTAMVTARGTQPVVTNPETQNPVVTNPNSQNPVVTNPETQNPVVTNPNTQNPVVTNPNTQNPVVTNPETQNPVVTNPNTQNPVVTNPETQNPATQFPTNQFPGVTPVVEDNVTYTNPVAQTALQGRDSLKSEAQVYRVKQDSLITAAGNADGEDRQELLTEASEAQRQAWDRDAQASERQGEANTTQFNTNQNLLDGYRNGAAGNSTDKVQQAELVNDEARVYLEKARDKREQARLAPSPYSRKTALDEAEDFEAKALQKQQDALSLYRESGVQPSGVAVNPNTQTPNTQNPVVTNPNTQNPNTQNPVVTNPNTQNPVVTNPETQNPVVTNPNTQNPVVTNPNTQNPVVTNPNTQNPVVTNPNTQPVDPANTSRVATKLQPGETFKITPQPNTQPFVMDPPVASGIVYKVQVGAFRNAIPVDQFKGIQPLNGESVGNGITRYMAGEFVDFGNADAAKKEIRAMGYSDAFVVAYRDGKRISIAEARGQQPNVQNPVVTNPNTQNPVVTNPNTQNPVVTNPNTQNPVVTNPNTQPTYQNQAPAIDVKTTKELFYTVQVGVYSRPVSSAKLYNLTGLFSETTPNGYVRYAAGKYNNPQAATDAKNNIVNIGIKDAFVTAYFEGQRISVERAAELERSGITPLGNGAANNNQQPVTQPQNNQQPQNQQPVTQPQNNQQPQNQQPVTQPQTQQPVTQPETQAPENMTPIPVIANTKPNIPDTGLIFSVQLGAYQQFVPIAMANRFLLFASKGVSIYRDSNSGLTVYQVGVYGSYKEAASIKEDALSKGINDAFIVAWKDGEKISMEEALKIRPQ